MKNIAVIYKSKYGTTKRYAEWIANELNAQLLEHKQVNPSDLEKYDCIVYGGGLYASGVDLVLKNPVKNLVIFTVGLANPKTTDYTEILNRNFTPERMENTKVFHLRGGIDYNKLGLIHKGMMSMMKQMTVGKKTQEELSDEDKLFVDTYGSKIDFADKETIGDLTEYVLNLN